MNTIMLTVRIYNNLQFMKKYVSYFMLIAIVSVFVSCASSKSTTTVLSGTDISKYKYVVFGTGDEGDAELADMLMMVQNEISEKLQVVSAEKAKTLIAFGEKHRTFLKKHWTFLKIPRHEFKNQSACLNQNSIY